MLTPQVSQRLQQAVALIQAGRQAEGRAALQSIVTQHPRVWQAWLWLASVSTNQQERIEALQQVISLNPTNEQARTALTQMGLEPPPVPSFDEPDLDVDSFSETGPGSETPGAGEEIPVEGEIVEPDQSFGGAPPPPPISPVVQPRPFLSRNDFLIIGAALAIVILMVGVIALISLSDDSNEGLSEDSAETAAANRPRIVSATPSDTPIPPPTVPTNTPSITPTPFVRNTLPPTWTPTHTFTPSLTYTRRPTMTSLPTRTPFATGVPLEEVLPQLRFNEDKIRIWG